jgi:hypothetical protein
VSSEPEHHADCPDALEIVEKHHFCGRVRVLLTGEVPRLRPATHNLLELHNHHLAGAAA